MSAEKIGWRRDLIHARLLLRITLGTNILLHGVVREVAGLRGFAASLVPMFQRTPLPTWSVYGFGYVLPVCEALIGAAVLVGFRTRSVLSSGVMLMLVLMFGSSLRQDWPTVGIQLTYSFIYCVLLATAQFDRYSLDQLRDRSV